MSSIGRGPGREQLGQWICEVDRLLSFAEPEGFEDAAGYPGNRILASSTDFGTAV